MQAMWNMVVDVWWGGRWGHLKGENGMAMSGLGCKNRSVGSGGHFSCLSVVIAPRNNSQSSHHV